MRIVKLTPKPRKNPNLPVEAESIIPEHFMDNNACSFGDLTVWEGNKERKFCDFFDIEISGEAASPDDIELVLAGETRTIKRIGEYMAAGKITVEGDIGMHCGNFMSGGVIEIMGNADGWLGREMRGGRILCHGNAGHYCGSGYRGEKRGMRGGVLEVMGDAGDFCAEFLAGGEIIIHGSCGDMTGVDMRDGVLKVYGECRRACGNMKGGTAYFYGKVNAMHPTFRDEGETDVDGKIMHHFTGDVANRGKGSLYVKEYEYY
jgi:formylmethanofuran dehydrogenase subunit C